MAFVCDQLGKLNEMGYLLRESMMSIMYYFIIVAHWLLGICSGISCYKLCALGWRECTIYHVRDVLVVRIENKQLVYAFAYRLATQTVGNIMSRRYL